MPTSKSSSSKLSKTSRAAAAKKRAQGVLKVEKVVATDARKIASVGGSQFKGFIDFIRTQGVVGLAVGLVLGGAVSTLVKSLVDNVIMPPLGLLLGSSQGIEGLQWTVGKTSDGQLSILHYGTFLNDFINFVIIALVIYVVLKLLRVDQLDKKKA
jgi:large conductance mechanosensitive channel